MNSPNGIISYLETHYIISSTIEDLLRKDECPSMLKDCQDVFEVMAIARNLTSKFEMEFKGFDWDSSNESWLEKLPSWVRNQLDIS